jgi:hypothetical protein
MEERAPFLEHSIIRVEEMARLIERALNFSDKLIAWMDMRNSFVTITAVY